MKKWLQRVRGAIGLGLTWAAGWSPIGALVGLVEGTLLGFPLGVVVVNYTILFAVMGFIGGGIFSSVLRLTEGRRRFDELSLPRFAVWGAAGGVVLGVFASAIGILGPGLSMLDAVIVGVSTLLGAGSAAGSLAIARRTHDHDALEAGRGVGEIGPAAEV